MGGMLSFIPAGTIHVISILWKASEVADAKVAAAAWLVPCRLGAVRGFSVLPFCLTSFFENGDKKRPSTFRRLRPVNGQFFGIQFFKLAGGERFVKTVCGRQVHRG